MRTDTASGFTVGGGGGGSSGSGGGAPAARRNPNPPAPLSSSSGVILGPRKRQLQKQPQVQVQVQEQEEVNTTTSRWKTPPPPRRRRIKGRTSAWRQQSFLQTRLGVLILFAAGALLILLLVGALVLLLLLWAGKGEEEGDNASTTRSSRGMQRVLSDYTYNKPIKIAAEDTSGSISISSQQHQEKQQQQQQQQQHRRRITTASLHQHHHHHHQQQQPEASSTSSLRKRQQQQQQHLSTTMESSGQISGNINEKTVFFPMVFWDTAATTTTTIAAAAAAAAAAATSKQYSTTTLQLPPRIEVWQPVGDDEEEYSESGDESADLHHQKEEEEHLPSPPSPPFDITRDYGGLDLADFLEDRKQEQQQQEQQQEQDLDDEDMMMIPLVVKIRYASFSEMLNAEEEELEEEGEEEEDWLDEVDEDYVAYYAFDDDTERGRRAAYNGVNPLEDEETTCRRVAEHRLAFPNCNDFHQLDYAGIGKTYETDFTYINHGTFREVFGMEHSYTDASAASADAAAAATGQEHHDSNKKEKMAIKEILFSKSGTADTELFEYVRMDALIAERLSSNPRTFDIYGFCGLSILSEFFYHGDIGDRAMADDEQEVEEGVDDIAAADTILTPQQKLVLALEMAQGLAILHGYKNGMILHSDVQMGQFLLNQDKTMLKLNDFNRAEFILWDEGHQSYCQHRNGQGHINWRSPEEYRNDALSDKIDVWSFGNNMYALLTGVEPIPSEKGQPRPDKQIVKGKTGYIDPKYLLHKPERVMAILIQKCFEYNPVNRPTMFELVEELSKAVVEMEQELGASRKDILQQL